MNNNLVGFTIGMLLLIVGGACVIPAALDWHDGHDNYKAFMNCAIVCMFFSGGLILANWNCNKDISIRHTFVLTTFSWLAFGLFTSLPLYFSTLGLSFTDAVFEAVSGITTTGSTVLSGLDSMSRGILVWRSLTQWIGGIGIIAFAIIILPVLRVGGMSLFQTESSEQSDKITPRMTTFVISILKIYAALTILCAICYSLLGMSTFDAINHAMTTLPTGGYSTHDASFGYFQSSALHYVCALFMLAGGIPFVLYLQVFTRKEFNFFKDEQFKTLMFILFGFIFFLTFWLNATGRMDFLSALRDVTFNIISVITTTGFATTDYTLWGSFSTIFFFFVTYMGACAGSTTGGVKTMRLIILAKAVGKQVRSLIFTRGVFTMTYQGKPFTETTAAGVMGFLGIFVISNTFLTIALCLVGLDFSTAISGAATALANVGPGIGDIIGPAGNFSSLPDSAKWLLCFGMILGRLEVMTVLVLFTNHFWRA